MVQEEMKKNNTINIFENKEKIKSNKLLISTLIAVLIGVMIVASAVSAQTTSLPLIKVTLINQEPDPVSPGNTFKMKFRIENYGGSPAENMRAKIVAKYPFSFYGDNEEKELGTLTGYQTGDLGVRREWNLLADSGATTGEHTIELWYSIKGGSWIKAGDYIVNVRSRDAVLAINEIKTDCADNIIPGTSTKVSFVLENLADNTLRDIKLNLGIYNTLSSGTSVTVLELPFTPIGSGNEKTLKELKVGETKEVSFNLFTDADAESKVYKVPYTLTYSDSAGTNFSRTGVVGLIVQATPDLSVNIEKTEIYQAGTKGKVEIKIVNKGFSDVKFLDVRLLEGEHFKLLSNPEVYIGKLESDDYETADYTILVDKEAEEKIVLPIKIEYRDANGKLFTQQIPLELRLFKGAELKQRVNGKNSTTTVLIVIGVLIVAGIVIYRKIRKNKRKKE